MLIMIIFLGIAYLFLTSGMQFLGVFFIVMAFTWLLLAIMIGLWRE